MSNIINFKRRGKEETPAAQEFNTAADFNYVPDTQDYKLLDSMLNSIEYNLLTSDQKSSQMLTHWVVEFLNSNPELAEEVKKSWPEFVNSPEVQVLLSEALHALPAAPEYLKLLEGASPELKFSTFEKLFLQVHYKIPADNVNTVLIDLRKNLVASLPLGIFLNTFLDLSESHESVKALKNKHLSFVLRKMAYSLSDKPVVQKQFMAYAAEAVGGFRMTKEMMEAA